MFRKILLGTAGFLMASGMAATGANAVLIDDFSTGLSAVGGAIILVGPGSAFDLSSGAGILGGDRELTVVNSGPDSNVVSANAIGGSFQHNNGNGSGTSLLRWDGVGGGSGLDFNLGNVDLTQGGVDTIHFSILAADLSGSFVTLTLYTDATHFSAALVPLASGPAERFFSLASIATIFSGSGGGVNLTQVNAIDLFMDGSDSFDVSLDFIETANTDGDITDIVSSVPEPASMTLIGAGLMGLAAMVRRRKA